MCSIVYIRCKTDMLVTLLSLYSILSRDPIAVIAFKYGTNTSSFGLVRQLQ